MGVEVETIRLTPEQQEIVNNNSKMVRSIIKKEYNVSGEDYEDAYQEGLIGLCLAAQRFDESRGFAFSTFAYRYIQGYISRYMREYKGNCYGIKVSRILKDLKTKAYKEKCANPNITDEDLAKKLDITVETLGSLDIKVELLDAETSEDGALDLYGLIGYEDAGLEEIEYMELADSISRDIHEQFSGRLADLLDEIVWNQVYFNSGFKQSEISLKYNLSQSYVSRVIKKFRGLVGDKYLKN